jgi:hypothetical protein
VRACGRKQYAPPPPLPPLQASYSVYLLKKVHFPLQHSGITHSGEIAPMTIPDEIQPLLDDYLALMQAQLPELLGALYLHGSIALGAFQQHTSDIDFVTVINRCCTDDDKHTLAHIHRTLTQKYPQWTMDGCYLQWADLGKIGTEIAPYPHINEGHFNPEAQGTVNYVTWWLLKNQGVAVIGTDPKTLEMRIDWDAFMRDMQNNMNSYWRSFTTAPHRILWLLDDYGVQWAVLGVLRQFYTFREHAIVSKIEAGEYALNCLPQRWHRIIQAAINIRKQQPDTLYRWRIVRMLEAYQFLRYIIDLCNKNFT